MLQATEGNDADVAASGPAQADETLLGAATGPAAAGIAAAAGGLAVALGGREQPAAALGAPAPAAAAPAAAAAAPAAAAPVAVKAPEIDLLGGDDLYVPNGADAGRCSASRHCKQRHIRQCSMFIVVTCRNFFCWHCMSTQVWRLVSGC